MLKLVLLLGCTDEPPPPLVPLHLEPAPAPAWFIVTWEEVKHSQEGSIGEANHATPFFDTLSAQGVRFMETRTVSPMRLPALASLHTGRGPPAHGLRVNQTADRLSELPTAAMLLSEEGFRSAAFISGTANGRDNGLLVGFDTVSVPSVGTQRSDAETINQAIQWINGLPPQDSLFAWIHLSSPVQPWLLPIGYESLNGLDVYSETIAELDRQTKRLFSALETNGRASSARMFVAGTHGNSLGENRESRPGWYAYESTIRVPMVLWWGIEADVELNRGTQVNGRSSLLDILPTIGAIEGFDVPQQEGISLLAPASSGMMPQRELAFESLYPAVGWGALPIFGVIDESGQTWFEGSPPALYDLQTDPGQLQNRYDESMEDEARALFERFPRAWAPPLNHTTVDGPPTETITGPDEWIQNRYWDRTSPHDLYPLIRDLVSDNPRLNPHHLVDTCMELLEQLGPQPELIRLTIHHLDQIGQRKRANEILERHQSESPEWQNLLSERRSQDRQQRALLSRIREALTHHPQHETAPMDLAVTLTWLEEWSEAEALLIAITAREPSNIRAHLLLARIYLKQHNPERALRILENVQNGELDASIACEKGRVLYRYTNREEEAVRHLQTCHSNNGNLHWADRQVIITQSPN